MIHALRNVRRHLLSENKFTRYLAYALGEIVLVIIGILVALYINGLNDARKERQRELAYLENIKSDLGLSIAEMDKYLATRTANIAAAKRLVGYFEGVPVTYYNAYNQDSVGIYSWKKFYLSDNTFQELVNSGGMDVISNSRIKNQLLDIESLYKKMKSEEDHFRYDTEKLLYEPLYATTDLNPLVDNYAFHASQGQAGRDVVLTSDTFAESMKSRLLKNGFVMTILEFETMNAQMTELKVRSQALIASIDQEIKDPR